MTHPIRPPADDLVDIQTSWGIMPRWKARALALAEIQTVLREARADKTSGDSVGNRRPPTRPRP